MKLKTLKDLCAQDGLCDICLDIKAEAIKWMNEFYCSSDQALWNKFFNITEEDIILSDVRKQFIRQSDGSFKEEDLE